MRVAFAMIINLLIIRDPRVLICWLHEPRWRHSRTGIWENVASSALQVDWYVLTVHALHKVVNWPIYRHCIWEVQPQRPCRVRWYSPHTIGLPDECWIVTRWFSENFHWMWSLFSFNCSSQHLLPSLCNSASIKGIRTVGPYVSHTLYRNRRFEARKLWGSDVLLRRLRQIHDLPDIATSWLCTIQAHFRWRDWWKDGFNNIAPSLRLQ